MKRKKIALFMATILLTSTCLTTVGYAKTNVSTISQMENIEVSSELSTNDLKGISTNIDTVLSNKYQIMKNRKINKAYVKDTKLQEVLDSTNAFNIAWYDKVNLRISKFDSKVNLTEVTKLEDNKFLVKVSYDITFMLKGKSSESASLGELYEFEVVKEDDQWYITKMIEVVRDDNNENVRALSNENTLVLEDMSDSEYNENLDNQLEAINDCSLNMDKYAEEITNPDLADDEVDENDGIATYAYSGYNSNLAVSYAHIYAFGTPNSNYKYYSGNDCTNFVSQAVHNGGVPTTSTWKDGTPAFINVNKFYSYMRNNGYTSGGDSSSGSRLGDVIQLYNSGKGTWSHTVIITGKDSSGWLYSAHSSSRKDYPIASVYPSSTYTNIRYIKFWH